jgi:hypothetical protein
MSGDRAIVVEVFIAAPVEQVWERTQEPEQHVRWDLRFDSIKYLDRVDARGHRLMEYRTSIGFGVSVRGSGNYLQSKIFEHSSFGFDSDDWKSLITAGTGVWIYERVPGGTNFKTVYDYRARFGLPGRIADRVFFRPVMRLATEWGFETLRLWCEGDLDAVARRHSRVRFAWFFARRILGRRPAPGAAASRLGTHAPAA